MIKNEWMLPAQVNVVPEFKSEQCKQVVKEELACLDVVIKAADEGQRKDYINDTARRIVSFKELRRHAFGKSVVIKTEREGVLTFRVSQANCEFASTKLGYSTPMSAVGRLCRLAYLGFSGTSKFWGDYEVIEVRSFTRFNGLQAEDNIRNFQLMQQHVYNSNQGHDEDLFNVKNLRKSLEKWIGFKSEITAETPDLSDANDTAGAGYLMFDGYDDDYDDDVDETEEIETGDLLHSDYDQSDFYGISNHFYLNPTEKQMEVMTSHVSSGPMLVEGVAGSGKTCVAIGRAKTLCDSAGGGDRLDGDNSSDFFAQESSVGFVRTGELVQYLKATCLELGLSHLPIQEYKVLQHELRSSRDIEQRPAKSIDNKGNSTLPKYKYLDQIDYEYQTETTMVWLEEVDQLIAQLLKDRLTGLLTKIALPDNIQWNASFTKSSAESILNSVLEQFQNQLQLIANQLSAPEGASRPFCIDGYLNSAMKLLHKLEKDWFSKDSIWITPGQDQWVKVTNNDEALKKLREYGACFVRVDQRIISSVLLSSIEDLRAIHSKIQIIDAQGETVEHDNIENLWATLQLGKYHCLLLGQNIPISIITQDELMFDIAAGRLSVAIDARIFPATRTNPLFLSLIRVNKEGGKSKSVLSKILLSQITNGLFSNIKYADLYLAALKNDKNSRSKIKNQRVIERLEQKSLTSHDIDLLLAIAQVMSRGAKELKGSNSHLEEQENYFRTVFIDEVQDFTEIQVFLMGRQVDQEYNSVTMVGDLYQQLYAGSASDPAKCFPYQGSIDKTLLIENKRQEHRPKLMALTSVFRAEIQGDKRLQSCLEEHKEILRSNTRNQDEISLVDLDFDSANDKIVELIKQQPKGRTIAVVLPTTALALKIEQRLHARLAEEDFRESYVATQVDLSKKYLVHFSSPEHIKGLEFDTLIMVGLEFIDWNKADELNKVYVCISRPRKQLAVLADFTKIPSEFIELFT